jgi:hypothetical protein
MKKQILGLIFALATPQSYSGSPLTVSQISSENLPFAVALIPGLKNNQQKEQLLSLKSQLLSVGGRQACVVFFETSQPGSRDVLPQLALFEKQGDNWTLKNKTPALSFFEDRSGESLYTNGRSEKVTPDFSPYQMSETATAFGFRVATASTTSGAIDDTTHLVLLAASNELQFEKLTTLLMAGDYQFYPGGAGGADEANQYIYELKFNRVLNVLKDKKNGRFVWRVTRTKHKETMKGASAKDFKVDAPPKQVDLIWNGSSYVETKVP